eukprot:symbB.v1.2.020891.t1/scaffold1778.1/size101634/11
MPFCSRLVLGDYHEAIDKLCASFNGHGDRTSVSKAVKRLLACQTSQDLLRPMKTWDGLRLNIPHCRMLCVWWEGFPEAQKCMNLLQNVYDLSSRNSNIMTEAQLEELWFGILGFTVRKQESVSESTASERRKAGLRVLAYLSLPRCLKWICAEFGQSTLGIWKEPLQSMLSGLGFQQGLLQAAASVAAQDVMKPFVVLKTCGSRGALVSPRRATVDGGVVKVPLVAPTKAASRFSLDIRKLQASSATKRKKRCCGLKLLRSRFRHGNWLTQVHEQSKRFATFCKWPLRIRMRKVSKFAAGFGRKTS